MGRPLVRRSQSRWIASQLQQYRSVPRTPETWRVLYAAFSAKFPYGGLDGQPISLHQYKSHAHYVQRKIKEERDADADRAQAHLLEREQRRQQQLRLPPTKRSAGDLRMKYEMSTPTTPKERPKAQERPKLLRTRKTAAAFAAAEEARNGTHSYTPEERRSTKRKHGALGDDHDHDHVVVKQEGGLSQAELDRDRLAIELRECQASLKRMKQSAHAWKVKYEELLQATEPHAPKAIVGSGDHGFSLTMNINVDVSQNGTHVRTDHHAMRLHGVGSVDQARSKRR